MSCGGHRLLQSKIEAEVAFVLGDDFTDGPLDAAQVRAAVAGATAALEIVDSRIAGWDITVGDTVADASSGQGTAGPSAPPSSAALGTADEGCRSG